MGRTTGGERGRKEIVIYICYCRAEILCPKWGGRRAIGAFLHCALRIFSIRFPGRRYFPHKFKPFQDMRKILCTYTTSTAPGISSR